MMLADTLLRGAAMAAALMIATVMLATPSARRAGWSAFAVAVTSAGYLLASAPFSASLAPGPGGVAVLGAILLPVAFTWLVTEIFLDASRDRKLWLWLASATVPLALAATRFPGAGLLRGALLLLLYLSLLYVAMVTARGDLVERRRQFRPAFLGVMAALGAVITMTELAGWNDPLPPIVYPLQSTVFLGLSVAFGLWALRARDGIWPAPDRAESHSAPGSETMDRALICRLQTAMAEGVWRQEGLTIRDLSVRVSAPEHRVRVAINRGLGFRNFPDYINSHRIDAAKLALRAPENARKTVLEIAYDSGFASLGPFNKAFRARTGQNPTEFRRSALDLSSKSN